MFSLKKIPLYFVPLFLGGCTQLSLETTPACSPPLSPLETTFSIKQLDQIPSNEAPCSKIPVPGGQLVLESDDLNQNFAELPALNSLCFTVETNSEISIKFDDNIKVIEPSNQIENTLQVFELKGLKDQTHDLEVQFQDSVQDDRYVKINTYYPNHTLKINSTMANADEALIVAQAELFKWKELDGLSIAMKAIPLYTEDCGVEAFAIDVKDRQPNLEGYLILRRNEFIPISGGGTMMRGDETVLDQLPKEYELLYGPLENQDYKFLLGSDGTIRLEATLPDGRVNFVQSCGGLDCTDVSFNKSEHYTGEDFIKERRKLLVEDLIRVSTFKEEDLYAEPKATGGI